MDSRLVLAVLFAETTLAYTNKLDSCRAFAALWGGGCGGTESTNAYQTADWNVAGAGVDTSNCATGDSSVFALAPITGAKVNSYSIFSRNCITCRQSGTDVFIRYQSNNMPKICYGSNVEQTSQFPKAQIFDFEVVWNTDVLNKQKIADINTSTEALTTALLCNY